MSRKELVLLLHSNREVPFVHEILRGGTPSLTVHEHENEFYVIPTGKDVKKLLMSGNCLKMYDEAACIWFCENYQSFKVTPTEETGEVI